MYLDAPLSYVADPVFLYVGTGIAFSEANASFRRAYGGDVMSGYIKAKEHTVKPVFHPLPPKTRVVSFNAIKRTSCCGNVAKMAKFTLRRGATSRVCALIIVMKINVVNIARL